MKVLQELLHLDPHASGLLKEYTLFRERVNQMRSESCAPFSATIHAAVSDTANDSNRTSRSPLQPFPDRESACSHPATAILRQWNGCGHLGAMTM